MNSAALYEPLRAGIADVYASSARAGANMRAVTHAVELLREALLADGDIFDLWLVFDDQLGHASASAFQPAMSELHAQFVTCALTSLVEETAAGGTNAWCTTFARAFGDGNWRYDLLRALNAARLPAVQELPAPFNDQARLDAIEEQISTDRWTEVYDWFVFLAHYPAIENELKARMLVIAAEIQLYHFRRPSRVRALLDEAATLAPEHPRLLIGHGGLHLEINTPASLEEAGRCFTKVIAERPRLSDGYVHLGDLKERAGDFSAAESLYQEAIANAPGTVGGYRRLYRLYGKPHWFDARAERRSDLARRIAILDDDEAAQKVEEGALLRANLLWEKARAAYLNALSLKPRLLPAHTGIAFSWVEEAIHPTTPPAHAESCRAAATIAIANLRGGFPTAPDSYWIAGWASETEKNWKEAISWFDRVRELHPEWEPTVRVRVAGAWRFLEDLAAAGTELKRVTEIEPEHTYLPLEMNELGEAAYRADDRELALRCFAEAHTLRGEIAEEDYQNRLGNLHFWFNEFETAADHYRRAIAIKPDDAVLHGNLATALANIVRPGSQEELAREEIAELAEAQRLAPADNDYTERLDKARARLDFITRYGEIALGYKHAGLPVRVVLEPGLLPLIIQEGTSNLSSDLLTQTKAVRERIHRETGVTVPGWQFSDFQALPSETVQIIVVNEPRIAGALEPGDAPSRMAEIVRRVEDQLRRVLPQFVMHQETAASLEAIDSPTCREIALQPVRLTAFVRFLRGLVAAGTPIGDLPSLAEQFSRESNALPKSNEHWTAWSWETPLPGAELSVNLGGGLAAQLEVLKTELDQSRMWLLDFSGIMLPKITLNDGHDLSPWGFRFILNGKVIVENNGLSEGELWIAQTPETLPAHWQARRRPDGVGLVGSIVRASAAETKEHFKGVTVRSPFVYASVELGFALSQNSTACIDLAQVEHRLALISPSHPVLVKSVRVHLSREELVDSLRLRLPSGRLLRCFPNALEDVLASVQPAANEP